MKKDKKKMRSRYIKDDLYELNNHSMETVIVSFAVRRCTYF